MKQNFELFIKRDFSAFVGDTFTFFKIEGKNYFKNYFIINGGLLLLLLVLLYFFIRFFYDGFYTSIATIDNSNPFAELFYTNQPLFIGLTCLFVVLIILVSIINYLYPVVYLHLLVQKTEITTQILLTEIKRKIGKTVLFGILSFATFLPISVVLSMLLLALVMIIIGIPIALLFFPALFSWIALSYYSYISNSSTSFLSGLKQSFYMLKKNFFAIIGSTFIMYIINQVIISIVVGIPYVISVLGVFINPEAVQENPEEQMLFFTIILSIIMIISILVSYILQNIILINQGIIYYSSLEEVNNVSSNTEIDLIGTDEA